MDRPAASDPTGFKMNHSAPRKILVAISDPMIPAHRAVKRAEQIAFNSGASLEFFSAVRSPTIPFGAPRFEADQVIQVTLERSRAALERLAKPLRREEIVVETTVCLTEVVHEAILQQARAGGADLIILEARRHGPLSRMLLGQVDFELIRHSPIPILIVKDPKPWRSPRVLAALDPFHAHDKPREMDDRIVSAANSMTALFGGSVHAVHVYWPLAELFPHVVIEPAIMAVTPREERSYAAKLKQAFNQALAAYGFSDKRRHLTRGDPGTQLPLLARSLKARLMVIGAVSRSGFGHSFIGNTAERVLDSLPCDVLIVPAPLKKSG